MQMFLWPCFFQHNFVKTNRIIHWFFFFLHFILKWISIIFQFFFWFTGRSAFMKRGGFLIWYKFDNNKSIEESFTKLIKQGNTTFSCNNVALRKKIITLLQLHDALCRNDTDECIFIHTFIYIIKDWDVALLRFLYLQYSGNVLLQK